jgi:hypothetical protein
MTSPSRRWRRKSDPSEMKCEDWEANWLHLRKSVSMTCSSVGLFKIWKNNKNVLELYYILVGNNCKNIYPGFIHVRDRESPIQGLSKDIQGHMYQQIQGLNTEEKAYRNQYNVTFNCSKRNFNVFQTVQIWTCKINSTKCPFSNVKQFQKISIN